MPLERLEDLLLEVAPPIVHAARPLHGAGAEQQPCPPRAPGISGGCGGGGRGAAPRLRRAGRGGAPIPEVSMKTPCPRWPGVRAPPPATWLENSPAPVGQAGAR